MAVVVVTIATGLAPSAVQASVTTVPCGTSGTFTIDTNVVTGRTSCVGTVVIPEGVTSIANDAFFFASGPTSIAIPASVTSIGVTAFSGMDLLASFTVAEANPNFSSLDGVLFNKTKTVLVQTPGGLPATTYSVPASVTTIGNDAFQLTNLNSITIPPNVTTIGNGAFGGSQIASVVFSGTSTLATIGGYVFNGMPNLASITIPPSVTSIGAGAFIGSGLTLITIPPSVTSIGESAFQAFDLASVFFSGTSTLATIGANAFSGTRLTSFTVPASVTTIEAGAFVNMGLLASFVVEEANPNFSSLNGVLFDKQKTSLINYPLAKTGTSYSIPSSVASIQAFAFNEDSSLTSVIIPSSVTTIGNYAFSKASRLNVYFLGDAPATVGNEAFENVGGKAYIKTGATGFAAAGGIWNRLTVAVLDDGARSCTSGTYQIQDFVVRNGFSCVGEAVIPDGVRAIDESAFQSNESLISVTIPATTTFIHSNSFALAPALTSFSVDSANPNFSSEEGILFNKLKSSLLLFPPAKVASYVVPASVVTIADRAFINGSLTSITIPGNVESIGSHAFFGAEGLTSVTFSGTSRLASIGENAFKQSKLETINIPASVTIIGDAAFALTPLRSVTFAVNSSLTTISSSMFERTSLTSITIPASVTSIGSYAFYGASQLANVVFLGNAPTPVGVEAFTDVAAGAKATVVATATGFPAVGVPWNGLTISVGTSPAAPPAATPPAATPPAAAPPAADLAAQAAAADLASRTVKAKARFASKSLAKQVGVTMVSSKAKVTFTVARSSRKICVQSGTRLRTLKKGNCRVTFTVQEPKPKKGKALKPKRTTKTLVVQ